MIVSGFLVLRRATATEVAFIAAVVFCLPLFEAPKNVLSAVFLIAWLVQAIRTKNLGQSSRFDILIFGLAAVLWIAPFFSEFGYIITPLNSAPRWTLLALFVLSASRLDYTKGQVAVILSALMIGGVIAVIESIWVWSLNGKPYPEFRSVGHVNHSSMYSLVSLAAGIGAVWLPNRWLKVLAFCAIISTVAYLPPSRSLVGGMAIVAILMVGAGVFAVTRSSVRSLVVTTLSIAIVLGSVLSSPPASGLRQEMVARVTGDNILSSRDKILNSALAVWDQNPIFGTGWFSFGVATSEARVRAALLEDGKNYSEDNYAHLPHGHNLWTTMLIERGLVGIVLVTALLFLYFWTFLPLAMSRDRMEPSDRGVAVAALLVAVGFTVAGLGNTTMMNEHGHAGMAFVAVAYGYLRGRGIIHSSERQPR